MVQIIYRILYLFPMWLQKSFFQSEQHLPLIYPNVNLSIIIDIAIAIAMKVVNITYVMIKLQFKLPQALISRGFTRRTVFHALLFSKKGLID